MAEMDPERAKSILAVAEQFLSKRNADNAATVLRAWLVARGFEQDRWGNYIRPGVEGWRYKFSPRVLHKQKTYDGSYRKEWHNITNMPLIDTAVIAITKAAEALKDEATLAKVRGAADKRKASAEKREQALKAKEREAIVEVLVAKKTAIAFPVETRLTLRNKHWPSAEVAAILADPKRSQVAKAVEFQQQARFAYTAKLAAGEPIPADNEFASCMTPPVASVYTDLNYFWAERFDGVDYTIEISHRTPGAALIIIGQTGGMGAVDPFSLSMQMDPRYGQRRGDGYIVGKLLDPKRDGRFRPVLTMIGTAGDKRKGVGTRLLKLWCLMSGAWAEDNRWIAEAITDEGAAFFLHMQEKGLLKIIGQSGANAMMECP